MNNIYEKRENRQKWLESLHSRVKRVLERKSLHRLERKRARALIEKIEEQFTTISWEIYEKRRGKNGIFRTTK
jgi:oligoribonuclease NrnB/cAMP/cGMP phosphodiesterase (DHH superfamily)